MKGTDGMHDATRGRRRFGMVGIAATIAAGAALMFGAPPVYADDEPEADPPQRRPLSLDELLGLPSGSPQDQAQSARDAEEAARREAEEALRRRLEHGRRTVSAFSEAIESMMVSADLLDTRFDPGIGTQRIQEDIIAKLTHLIEEASREPTPSSSSRQPQPDQQRDPGRQESQPSQQQAQSNGSGDQEGEPPAMQQGDIHTMIGETRSEWGALPQRIREMLLQGRDEKFSTLYEQLTSEYYRRLASE